MLHYPTLLSCKTVRQLFPGSNVNLVCIKLSQKTGQIIITFIVIYSFFGNLSNYSKYFTTGRKIKYLVYRIMLPLIFHIVSVILININHYLIFFNLIINVSYAIFTTPLSLVLILTCTSQTLS